MSQEGKGKRNSPALVGVPVVWLGINTLALIGGHQLIVVVHSHTSTNNLADTGHQAVNRLGDATVFLVLLHVECLDLDGEVSQEDGAVDDVGHAALGSFSDIITELVGLVLLVGNVVFDQPVDGFRVLHAHEGALRHLEFGVELLDDGGNLRVAHGDLNDTAHDLFQVDEQVVEGDVVEFGFDVCVLGKMAAGEGLLGAERLLNAVDVAHGGEDSLEVELRRLSEESLLAVVVELEQGSTAFNLGLDKCGRRDLAAADLAVDLVESELDSVADEHDVGSDLTTEGQMAEVEKSLGITLGLDLVGDGVVTTRSLEEDFEVVGVEFAVVRSVGALGDLGEFTDNLHAALTLEGDGIVGLCEIALENALHEAVAITEGDEDETLLLAVAVDTTEDTDARALVGAGTTQLDVLVVELHLLGLGQGSILLDLDLLGLVKHLLATFFLLLQTDGEILLLCGLLLLGVGVVGGLLQGGLCGGLPFGLFGALADLVLGAVAMLEESVLDRLVGGLLGAGGGFGVEALLLVNVDGGFVGHVCGSMGG